VPKQNRLARLAPSRKQTVSFFTRLVTNRFSDFANRFKIVIESIDYQIEDFSREIYCRIGRRAGQAAEDF